MLDSTDENRVQEFDERARNWNYSLLEYEWLEMRMIRQGLLPKGVSIDLLCKKKRCAENTHFLKNGGVASIYSF